MAHVDHDAIDKHERGFEDVEEGLVADDGVLTSRVKVRVEEVDLFYFEVLDGAVDGSGEDDAAADVQR